MKTLKFISSRLNKNCLYALCLSIVFIITGCAPSFPEFQGADLVGKGKMKATPYFTSTSSDEEEFDGELQSSLGVILAYGLTDSYDGHIKYESIKGEGGLVDGSIISLGIKFKLYSIGNHRISGYLPLSYSTRNLKSFDFFDESEESNNESLNYQTIEPTLLVSSNLFDKLDLNYSAKMIFKIGGDDTGEDDSGFAFNFSLSIPIPNLPNLILIPEYGILNVGEDSFNHSGVGFAWEFNN